MSKFHINSRGEIRQCKATVQPCPLGENTPHFDDRAAAEKWIEESLSLQHQTTQSLSKRSLDRNNKRINELSKKHFSQDILKPNQEEADTHIKKMYEENKKIMDHLKENGVKHDFHYYTFTGSRDMNGVLRCGDINAYYSDPMDYSDENEKKLIEEKTLERALHLNSLIEELQNEAVDEPRVLYRYIKVPEGVTTEDYAKTIGHGGKIVDKGFTSTTEDPSFIHAQMFSRKNRKNKNKFIMLQMLTKKGVSMQSHDSEREGDLLSFEQERLLPIGVEFNVTNQLTKTIGTHEDRFKLAQQFDPYGDEPLPNKRILTLQLIDEDLL